MKKKKVDLFLFGNILVHGNASCLIHEGGNLYSNANPDEFDLSSAIVITGDFNVEDLDAKSRSVACTGYLTTIEKPEDGTGGKMDVYISIPISGHDPARQREIAEGVKRWFEKMGHRAWTPFDICPPSAPYPECMGRDIERLLKCDLVVACYGWRDSRGCRLEVAAAEIYGKAIMRINTPRFQDALMRYPIFSDFANRRHAQERASHDRHRIQDLADELH